MDTFLLVVFFVVIGAIMLLPAILPVIGAIRRSYVWFFVTAGALLAMWMDVDSPDDARWAMAYTLWAGICLFICVARGGAVFRQKRVKS